MTRPAFTVPLPFTIRGKLLSGLGAMLGIVALFLLFVVPAALREQAMRQARDQALSIARITAHGLAPALVFEDQAEMTKVMDGARIGGAVLYVVVADTAGRTLATADSLAAERAQYRRAVAEPGPVGEAYRAAVPIVHDGDTIGTLYLGLSLRAANAQVSSASRQMAAIILAVMVGGFVLALLLGRHLTRPIEQMAEAANAIQAGDLSRRSGVQSADEVGVLARTFDAMVDGLQLAQEALQTLNRDLAQRVAERTHELEEAYEEVVRAERTARENERRFRTLFESAVVGIAVVDLEGRVREANPAMARMWRTSSTALNGRFLSELGDTPDDATLPDAVRDVLSGRRELAEGTVSPRLEAGPTVFGHAVISPVRDADGRVLFAIAMVEDVTAARDLAERLRQSQRLEAVGRLAGGIAHDFNNILATINGIAELQLSEDVLDPAVRADLVEIRDAGMRAAALTRQMLAFGRRQQLQLQVLDLNVLLHDVSSMLRRMIGTDVTLQLTLGDGLPPVRADVSQLTQVFMNLAVNARDAMPLGGTLGIETTALTLQPDDARRLEVQTGAAVRVVVWDTGGGMDAVTMNRVFEPFFTTKEVGKGSGLGLATAYGIIKQSGGAIVVESQPGEGARFAITLPAADAPVDWPQPRPAVGHHSTGAESILLIEDDRDVRNVTARALRSSGFTVIECASGEDAIRRAEDPALQVDLLLSDVALPGMSGPAAVKRILDTRPSLPVLFVSGYPRNELDRHGLQRSDVHFLQKPVPLNELTKAIRRLVDQVPQ